MSQGPTSTPPASPPPAGDPPRRRVSPSLLATAPGRVLLAAAIASLLMHFALGVAAFDRPLGYVDPESLQSRPIVMRIRRAPEQVRPLDPRHGLAGVTEAADTPSLEDVSEALLKEAMEPPAPPTAEPELALRPIEEEPAAGPSDELAVELPGFELPPELLQMTNHSPGDLAYQGGDAAQAGSAAGPGGATGGAGAAARQLLSQASIGGNASGTTAGTGGGIALAEVAAPTISDTAPLDQRLLDIPLEAPQIDFAGVALEATTQLDVPEHLDHDFDYYLSRYEPEGAPGYFQVDILARQSLKKLKAMPKDVVFLVDTSSSVPQTWVTRVIRGVEQALWSLNEGDRFNIVLFNESPAFFSTQGTQPATMENIRKAGEFLKDARSIGWTDVNAALSRLLVRDVDPNRVYDLILISDGKPTRGVLDTRELINVITRDNSEASIYCIGIGRDPNRELLDFMAYRNRGFCVFVDRVEQADAAVRDLLSRLRYPLIKDVSLSVVGPAISEVHPLQLPTIHQGERFSIFGRYVQPDQFTMRVTGSNAGQRVDFTFTRDLHLAPLGKAAIASDWAFWKLHHLYSEIIRQGDREELLAQIRAIRTEYKLKTLYE